MSEEKWEAVEWHKPPFFIRRVLHGDHNGRYMLTLYGKTVKVIGYYSSLDAARNKVKDVLAKYLNEERKS